MKAGRNVIPAAEIGETPAGRTSLSRPRRSKTEEA